MLLFSSTPIYEDPGRSCVYKLASKLTSYRVVVTPTQVGVFGPGIEETFEIEEDIPASLSHEAQALMAILLLEEGE